MAEQDNIDRQAAPQDKPQENQQQKGEEPVPTTKQQLIEMLKQQLQKVQDQISSMQNTLEQEREKRKQLTGQLQEKEEKIKELLEQQSKTLGDKVHEGLYNTLQAANKMRADADSQIRTLAQDNTVLNQKIVHRDNTVIQQKGKILLNSKKIISLQQKKIDQQRKKDNLADKREQVKKNVEMMKQQHQRIQKQEKQLRSHIQNMKKLRLYLNKSLEGNAKNNYARGGKASVPDSFWNGP